MNSDNVEYFSTLELLELDSSCLQNNTNLNILRKFHKHRTWDSLPSSSDPAPSFQPTTNWGELWPTAGFNREEVGMAWGEIGNVSRSSTSLPTGPEIRKQFLTLKRLEERKLSGRYSRLFEGEQRFPLLLKPNNFDFGVSMIMRFVGWTE